MNKKINYLELAEKVLEEDFTPKEPKAMLKEDVEAYNKLIPALNKVENVFVQQFLKSSVGQTLGEQNLRALIKPGFDIIAVGVLLGGDENTRNDLNSFQTELNKFVSGKLIPIMTKAKFGSGMSGIANRIKGRMNQSKSLMGKLKSIFSKSKDETEVRQGSGKNTTEAPAQANSAEAPTSDAGTPPPTK